MEIQPESISFTSGLYWRRSAINGRKTVPVVLQLIGGRLRMWTAEALVFDVPTSDVSAKFSNLSTMFLTVAGQKYPVVGIGAALSPKFSEAQLAALREAQADAQRRVHSAGPSGAAGGVAAVAGSLAGGVTALAGLSLVVSDFASMRKSIRPWRDIFDQTNVTTNG